MDKIFKSLSFWQQPKILLLAVFLLGTYIFFPALGYDFVWDDNAYIRDNPSLGSLFHLPRFFMAELHLGQATGLYRPLFSASLALDHALFKKNPWGYHLTNALLHGVNSSLTAYLALLLFQNPYAALVTGAFFALHPVHPEAVAFISGRMDLLFTLFSLLALLALTKKFKTGSKAGFMVLAPLFFLLALLSKETAAAVLVPMALWLYFQNPREPKKWRGLILKIIPSLAVLIIYLGWRSWLLPSSMLSKIKLSLNNPPIFIFELCFRYLSFLIFPPQKVSYFYDPQSLAGHFYPLGVRFWFFAGVTIFSLSAVAYVIYRRRETAPLFALLLFPCLPSFYYNMQSGIMMIDRYLYLPSAGLALLAGWGWLRIPEKAKKWAGVGMVVLLLVYAGATLWRTTPWKNEETLFQSFKRESPPSAYISTWLGSVYKEQKRFPEAYREFSLAVNLAPGNPFYRNNLGWLLLEQGETAKARAVLAEALRLWPRDVAALEGMGLAYLLEGNKEMAARYLDRAAGADPENERIKNYKKLMAGEKKPGGE